MGFFSAFQSTAQPLEYCVLCERDNRMFRFRTNKGTYTIQGEWDRADIYRQNDNTFHVSLTKRRGNGGVIYEITSRKTSPNPVRYF